MGCRAKTMIFRICVDDDEAINNSLPYAVIVQDGQTTDLKRNAQRKEIYKNNKIRDRVAWTFSCHS